MENNKMLNENDIEQLTLQRLQSLSWEYRYGKDLPVHEGEFARGDLSGVVFIEQLREAVRKLNPQLPESAVDSVLKSATKSDIGDLVVRNQAFYKLLRDGVRVEYTLNGEQKIEMARLVDFEHWGNNRFVAVNQLEIRSRKGGKRIPDIIGFVNGLPLVVFELKNPLRESADLLQAFNQFETYKDEIAELFVYNQALIISDGIVARLGSLSADFQRFTPWKVVDEKNKSARLYFDDELQSLLNGLLQPKDLLDYIRYFVLFERDSVGKTIKKIAAYHQYYGVNEAVDSTIWATSEKGDRRIGVMWHTQGSGKSISMLFYAGKLLAQPELKNPTIVVVTDRNDLDGQLFQTFSSGKDLIKQTPQQVEDCEQLRQLLAQNEVGGVFFTTIQKFALNEEESRFPVLNERSNIIVISDEAHRSQYGFTQKLHNGKFQAGYARHLRDALPNASFIGFTGTPISLEDKDTQDVFGRYVSIYDLQDAVEDGATVPIIYEARQIKLAENANHDELFAEIDELLEGEENPKLRLREKLLGSEARLHDLAVDFVQHFANEVVDSKAMMVVSSRQICVDLYNEIIKLRPEWHSDNINEGAIKIVMTGSASDTPEMQKHIYSKQEKQTLERRFKDPTDPLKVVIVRDMWLTGFDAPCCNTMYIDKPMQGHNLMQAIARVNRVFRNKSRENGGLIVDYVGIADKLREATQQYTNSQGKGKLADSVIDVFFKMKERLEVIRTLFATPVEGKTFDVQTALEKDNPHDLLMAIRFAANHILSLDQLPFDGKAHEQHWFNKKETEPRKKAFLKAAGLVKKGYMLCGTLAEVEPYNQEIAFYDAVRAILTKREQKGIGTNERQILLKKLVNQTVYSEGVIDLFDLLEKPQPQISLLSEEFLQTVKNSPTKNLWVTAMERYLASEIKVKSGTNLTLQKDFEQRLKEALNQYHNHNLTVVEILDELFKMSQDFQERLALGKKLGLTKEELAFYEALSQNQSAKDLMSDEVLSKLAKEITETLRKSVTIDWQYKEAVRAKMRILVKRALQRYKYPPDKQEEAVTYVIKQAEEIAEDLTGL